MSKSKHARSVSRKHKAKQKAKARARKQAPKKRPVVQEPEPREERIGDSIREVYEDASRGTESPDVVVTNGDVLNELTNTADFDSGEAYMVTAEGINPLRSDE